MNKSGRITWHIVSLFLVFYFVFLYAKKSPEATEEKVIPVEKPIVVKEVFNIPIGERLTYNVYLKKMKVGTAILTFYGEKELNDKKANYITFITRLPFIVTDKEEIYANKNDFSPLKISRIIHKPASFPTRIEETYDQEKFSISLRKKGMFLSKRQVIQKEAKIHNAILLAYTYRRKLLVDGISIGSSFQITLPTIDLEVKLLGKETISTKLGEIEAYVFKSQPPKFELWVAANDKAIPLKIKQPGLLGYSLVFDSVEIVSGDSHEEDLAIEIKQEARKRKIKRRNEIKRIRAERRKAKLIKKQNRD
jgi:hypothetical protein